MQQRHIDLPGKPALQRLGRRGFMAGVAGAAVAVAGAGAAFAMPSVL